MKQPDWTKAPEGATHWDYMDAGKPEQWMRLVEGKWLYWSESEGWSYAGTGTRFTSKFVERPIRTKEQRENAELAESIIDRYKKLIED